MQDKVVLEHGMCGNCGNETEVLHYHPTPESCNSSCRGCIPITLADIDRVLVKYGQVGTWRERYTREKRAYLLSLHETLMKYLAEAPHAQSTARAN
jgi:hypothetical protein